MCCLKSSCCTFFFNTHSPSSAARLLCRYQLLSHATSLLLYCKTITPKICKPLLATPEATALTNKLSSLALLVVQGGLGALGLPTASLAACSASSTCRCYVLLLTVNLVCAIVPSVVLLWYKEWQHRGRFLQQLHRSNAATAAAAAAAEGSIWPQQRLDQFQEHQNQEQQQQQQQHSLRGQGRQEQQRQQHDGLRGPGHQEQQIEQHQEGWPVEGVQHQQQRPVEQQQGQGAGELRRHSQEEQRIGASFRSSSSRGRGTWARR